MHICIINDLLSSPNMEEHSKSNNLPEAIIFLGSKRSTISSQICILEAQKTFHISQVTHAQDEIRMT